MGELLEQLRAKKPARNVVFTAIEELSAKKRIKQFYQEYVEACGEAVAQMNIGYILGYYPSSTAKRWLDILPGVTHPIFGREIARGPNEAFAAGKKAFAEMQGGFKGGPE